MAIKQWLFQVCKHFCVIPPTVICRQKGATCAYLIRYSTCFVFFLDWRQILRMKTLSKLFSATVAFVLKFWLDTSCIPGICISLYMNNFFWIFLRSFCGIDAWVTAAEGLWAWLELSKQIWFIMAKVCLRFRFQISIIYHQVSFA